MERSVLFAHHDDVGHVGISKTKELILRHYWFPKLTQKVKIYIENCLKCIAFSPQYGKKEGFLHNIPKGNVPFDTIQIDHLGPLEKTRYKNKFIFVITDAFTKFTKLYSCKSTGTDEVTKHIAHWVQ